MVAPLPTPPLEMDNPPLTPELPSPPTMVFDRMVPTARPLENTVRTAVLDSIVPEATPPLDRFSRAKALMPLPTSVRPTVVPPGCPPNTALTTAPPETTELESTPPEATLTRAPLLSV